MKTVVENELVAHDQSELQKLLDKNVPKIYLCGSSFDIPKDVENTIFIGIGHEPTQVTVYSEELDFFWSKNNVFNNIKFDEKYWDRTEKLLQARSKISNFSFDCYKQLAEDGNIDGMIGVAKYYVEGLNGNQNFCKAEKYYKQAVDLGSSRATCYLAILYEFCFKDFEKAVRYYQKAANMGNDLAKKRMSFIGEIGDVENGKNDKVSTQTER